MDDDDAWSAVGLSARSLYSCLRKRASRLSCCFLGRHHFSPHHLELVLSSARQGTCNHGRIMMPEQTTNQRITRGQFRRAPQRSSQQQQRVIILHGTPLRYGAAGRQPTACRALVSRRPYHGAEPKWVCGEEPICSAEFWAYPWSPPSKQGGTQLQQRRWFRRASSPTPLFFCLTRRADAHDSSAHGLRCLERDCLAPLLPPVRNLRTLMTAHGNAAGGFAFVTLPRRRSWSSCPKPPRLALTLKPEHDSSGAGGTHLDLDDRNHTMPHHEQFKKRVERVAVVVFCRAWPRWHMSLVHHDISTAR
ncbi:hypothetical protein IWZ00DRAFT_342107 [Phyllosticta capitalensis]